MRRTQRTGANDTVVAQVDAVLVAPSTVFSHQPLVPVLDWRWDSVRVTLYECDMDGAMKITGACSSPTI